MDHDIDRFKWTHFKSFILPSLERFNPHIKLNFKEFFFFTIVVIKTIQQSVDYLMSHGKNSSQLFKSAIELDQSGNTHSKKYKRKLLDKPLLGSSSLIQIKFPQLQFLNIQCFGCVDLLRAVMKLRGCEQISVRFQKNLLMYMYKNLH